jgi:hypothetical protein
LFHHRGIPLLFDQVPYRQCIVKIIGTQLEDQYR